MLSVMNKPPSPLSCSLIFLEQSGVAAWFLQASYPSARRASGLTRSGLRKVSGGRARESPALLLQGGPIGREAQGSVEAETKCKAFLCTQALVSEHPETPVKPGWL